jgi:2-dehydropantoate 2-reductase
VTIVVVGAGAIGLLIAGRLAQAGRRVVLLARPGLADALAAHPPRIRAGREVVVAAGVMAVGALAELPERDRRPELAILAVKGYDTPGALDTVEALAPRALLTLQNGLGNEELLAARLGAERIIAGAITAAVVVEAPGCIVLARHGGIGLAPLALCPPLARAAQELRAAGFPVRTYADYRALKWSKALLTILGNATAAILDAPVDAIFGDRRLLALERLAFLEARGVMERLGARPVNLPGVPAALLAPAIRHAPEWALHGLLRRAVAGVRGGRLPSLHLDLKRGRERSEAEQLYGAIAAAADRVGAPAPVNRALWETVRSIAAGEAPWSAYRGRPERLLERVAP